MSGPVLSLSRTNASTTRGPSSRRSLLPLLLASTALAALSSQPVLAQAVEWHPAPGVAGPEAGSFDYMAGANWVGGAPPAGGEIADFGDSAGREVSFSSPPSDGIVVSGWRFAPTDPAASNYVILNTGGHHVSFVGSGVDVESGTVWFRNQDSGLYFFNATTAGAMTIHNAGGGDSVIVFSDDATAGTARITNERGQLVFIQQSSAGTSDIFNSASAYMEFRDAATAADAVLANEGIVFLYDESGLGHASVSNEANLSFFDTSSADSANIFNGSGWMDFWDGSTAGNATIENRYYITFRDTASAGGAQIDNRATLIFEDASTAGAAVIDSSSWLRFSHDSTAGSATITNTGMLQFFDGSTAGNATIENAADFFFRDGSSAGEARIFNHHGLYFADRATAANAGIENHDFLAFEHSSDAGSATIVNHGEVYFGDEATAGNAYITNHDTLGFADASSAGDATIVSAFGGITGFVGDSSGERARLIAEDGGLFDFSGHAGPSLGVGSIEGAGTWYLGATTLVTGANGFSTEVSGIIQDTGIYGGTGGGLVKLGEGVLTLSGTNTYTGETVVEAGALVVDGSSAGSSLTQVLDGAALGGTGTVGGLHVYGGGVLEPGNSIGTLTVDGDLVLASGSIYRVELNDGGDLAGVNNDLVHATGTALVADGMVVHLTPENGVDDGSTYAAGSTYTILRADGGLTVEGEQALRNDFAYLDFVLGHDATVYTATSHLAAGSFCLSTMSVNQCSTGDAAFALGAGHEAYDHLLGMSETQAGSALNQLSGEIHASSQHVIDQTFALFGRTLRHQGVAGIGAGNVGAQVFTATAMAYASAPSAPGVTAIDSATHIGLCR